MKEEREELRYKYLILNHFFEKMPDTFGSEGDDILVVSADLYDRLCSGVVLI